MDAHQIFHSCWHVWLPTGSKFVPTPEERLLSVVHALLHRCYKLPYSNAAQVLAQLIICLH